MAEYIKRNAIKSRLEDLVNWCQDLRKPGLKQALEMFDEIPAADVAPVVYGRWVTHYRSGTPVAEGYVSTCCDMWNNRKSDYCPNCGAKMDGGDNDATD